MVGSPHVPPPMTDGSKKPMSNRVKGGNYKTLPKRSLKKIVCQSNDVGPRISQNEALLSNHSSESIGILESAGKTRFLIAV